ncbi:hypothetical protein QMG61_17310, partial [Cryobacterium sp. PH31-AA6]|nr:hypothetical protein [Cryobacterium sp. PH31-AA6]
TPTGTQTSSLVRQVQSALANINATVTAAITALSYTRAEIDSKVASPGAITPTTVTASGAVSGLTGTFNSGITSLSVHDNLVTAGYVSVYVDSSGNFGYQPSASRFKQDVTPATIDPASFYAAEIVRFRYKQSVQAMGQAANIEIGGIAEQFVACGLGEYVTRDDDGTLTGIAYERLSIGLLGVVQSQNARLAAVEKYIAALGGVR